MIQIHPLLCIGLPDRDPIEYEKFINIVNQRRLKFMQVNGINIEEYSDDAWDKFKQTWKKKILK